jgi:hypothetical protein
MADPSDTGGAQLDIATSFLAVMLLYFVILLILAAQVGEGNRDYPHFRSTETTATVAHRQFRALNPFRRYWFVEGDRIAEIDLAAASALIPWEGAAPETQATLADGTRVSLAWGPGYGPTGFALDVARPEAADAALEQGGLWASSDPLDQFDSDMPGPADIVFVRRDAATEALGLLDRLTSDGLGPVVRLLDEAEGRRTARILRRPESFEVEGGFR